MFRLLLLFALLLSVFAEEQTVKTDSPEFGWIGEEIDAACMGECTTRLLKEQGPCRDFCGWCDHLKTQHDHLQRLEKQLHDGLPKHFHRPAVRFAMYDAARMQFKSKRDDHEMANWFTDHMDQVVKNLIKEREL